ncbi:hypothetical protein [Streptomyces anulatus]|uniref:hypothetical protein n=1 Tax=Streptomyces anulatus TaxID=1892 RepID=UPI0036A42AD5
MRGQVVAAGVGCHGVDGGCGDEVGVGSGEKERGKTGCLGWAENGAEVLDGFRGAGAGGDAGAAGGIEVLGDVQEQSVAQKSCLGAADADEGVLGCGAVVGQAGEEVLQGWNVVPWSTEVRWVRAVAVGVLGEPAGCGLEGGPVLAVGLAVVFRQQASSQVGPEAGHGGGRQIRECVVVVGSGLLDASSWCAVVGDGDSKVFVAVQADVKVC